MSSWISGRGLEFVEDAMDARRADVVGRLITADAGPEFRDGLYASLSADVARIVRARLECVGCGGSIEERMAELGSVSCQDCR